MSEKQTQPEAPKLVNPCPHPEDCPLGPKAAGYQCGCAVRVTSPGPEAADGQKTMTVTPHCSFCYVHRETMKGILAAQNRSSLVLAGALPHGRSN